MRFKVRGPFLCRSAALKRRNLVPAEILRRPDHRVDIVSVSLVQHSAAVKEESAPRRSDIYQLPAVTPNLFGRAGLQ
jgi:hypothetical protein